MKKYFALIAATLFSLSLMGCNTMEGVGEDVEAGGEAIEDTANDAR